MKHCTTRCKNFRTEAIEGLIVKYLDAARSYYITEQNLKNKLRLPKSNEWYIENHEFWEAELPKVTRLKNRNFRRAGRLLIEYTKRVDGKL
jgi:hypothetical protein